MDMHLDEVLNSTPCPAINFSDANPEDIATSSVAVIDTGMFTASESVVSLFPPPKKLGFWILDFGFWIWDSYLWCPTHSGLSVNAR